MHPWLLFIQVFSATHLIGAVTELEIYPGLQCSYSYDLEVHTHRGERSTKELNFKINTRVNLEVLHRHNAENDGFITKLELRHPRVIRNKGGRTIKHVVDHNLEEKLAQPFFFVQNPKGEVTRVFYPHDDSPDLVGMKKGVVSAFHLKLHPDVNMTSFNAEEEDDSGVHLAYYDVLHKNSTHVNFTKQWSGDDYSKLAGGRPVEGEKHVRSRYNSAVKIENNAIQSVKRSHFSELHDEKSYKRPLNNPDFQTQPDFDVKASGESHLKLLGCSVKPHRSKRSLPDENGKISLDNLKQDTLTHSDVHRMQWKRVGNPNKPTRTFYELLRCYWDRSTKMNELSQCIKELHYLARTDDKTHRKIANLTLSRSHQNFSTWSGLVGALVVKGDYATQIILSKALLSEDPRPLDDQEHSILLEAVFFIPARPLCPELLEALLSLHKNRSKSDEVTVRAMLIMSGLVRRVQDAGYNRSLSEKIAQHLHDSFKTHPARFHDDESEARETYLRNHIWAFGNLGHASSLSTIIRYLDHDSSGIRYSAVFALHKFPFNDTEHHLLHALKHDEQLTVKTGVIDVFLERRQNISDKMREGIEDALWLAEEGDELDSKITEFLDKHGDDSHHAIKQLRKRRATIRRKKRALIPALKPREFSLGPRRKWRKGFGGSKIGSELMMRFVNQVKLQIGIFGGKFEVDMDNSALFRANVLTWHFEILSGKAAFKMSARFKNDIPKDLIHTISDTADDILASVDSISSIFTKHIQNFIDKLKNYLPLDANAFLKFILEAAEFLKRSIQATKFGKSFSEIVKGFKNALRANGLWRKIAVLVTKLLRNLKGLSLSDGPFREAFQFLTELVDLISRTAFDLPQGFPGNFNIKEFLEHISRKYDSIGEAVADYFKKLGVSVPGNFFGMLHFKITLRFSVSLEKFRTVTIRLTDFGNNFLEMLSVFREIIRIELPRIHLPGFGLTTGGNSPFDFELLFDWRSRFNFKIDFSGPDFTKLNNFFRYLSKIFQQLDGPNIDLEKFFREFLPILRKEMSFKDQALLGNSTSLKIELWFRELMKEFGNILKSQNGKFLDFSDTAQFLQALENQAGKFSKKSLKKVCKLQEFMLKSSGKLQQFGENLEKETIVAIKKIEDEAQTVIEEIVNVTVYVERLKDNLQKNISETAKKFVDQFLTRLERSLEDVKELADNVAEFTNNSTDKLGGFCHKTADVSGEILDQIQAEAESAVKELAEFITTNSQGITSLVNRFKTVITNVENWQKKNLQKRLGKFARVAETLEEFLSLLKNDNKFLKSVHKVSTNVNDVLKHLNNLPEHAEKARQAADKVIDFATNAKRWETEVKKLNIRKKFKLDFDDQLRKLCNEFQVLAQDSVKKIQGDNLFKTFREFVTKETDALISRGVGKLDLLKEPLERVRSELGKVSESVREVEDVLIEMKPFSKNFSPVLKEVNQLPNCTQIGFILDDITKKCGKSGKAFSKQAYGEYQDLRSEVKAFVELLPDEWESLGLRKCVKGGTCLSEAFIKQGQGVAKKIKTLKRKFENKELFESLAPCKDAVEAFSVVVQKVKNISVSVEAFSLKDDVLKIKDLARRITGRFSGESDGQVERRANTGLAKKVKNLAQHVKKAKQTKEEIEKLVEEVFGKLESIYTENIEPFQDNLKNVEQKLQLSYDLSKKSNVINPSLQAVDAAVAAMTDFTGVAEKVVGPLEGTVLDVFSKTSEFTDVFDDKLKGYGEKLQKISDEVNGFLDKIISFLNSVQLRQKGLDIRKYKPWDQYSYCSKDVCLRLLRRSSTLYLKTVFLWKYPHLDDLSSYSQTGKWLIPGLFDDYKVRSIASLSKNEMILGMRGVASNTDKASLLVIIDMTSSNSQIVKIIQLQENNQPFTGDMGGVAVVKDTYIWMSSGDSLYAVKLSDVRNSMSTSGRPSTINIATKKSLSHSATSISYDSQESRIWVVDSGSYKVHSYDVSPFADVMSQKDTLETGQHTRGFAIVRQFDVKYAAVAKCALVAGYQCKVEFHKVDTGVLDKSTLHRVMRTPTGLEAIQAVDSEHLVTAFSSGTFSEKDKVERIAGDFEDRFFKFKLPILSTGFDVTENCIYLKVGGHFIIPAKRLFPLGELRCGVRRKRSALEKALEADVYTKDLEKHKRIRRQTTENVPCSRNFEGRPMKASHPIFPEVSIAVVVYGITVKFFFGVNAHYYANYRISLCLRDKEVRLALIPGAWVTVYAGASLSILIVEAGVTVEAKLLETYLIPEVAVRVDKWPLSACLELKMQMTPLSMRVYLWYRFRLCISVSVKKWFRVRISIRWCRKHTFAEWGWSSRSIHKMLFSNCERDKDHTPPGVGKCTAKQVANKKYFVQWHGFTENTEIQNYVVIIGSIKGSGDDHYSIQENRQSLLISDLDIMHGRSVYAAVFAYNAFGMKSRVANCPMFTARRRSPIITFVHDGETPDDIDYQADATSLAVNYGFKGTFADLSSVKWGISSSPECTLSENEANVLSLREVGESYTIKKTGLELANGGKYYIRVQIVDLLGLATVACSDGVTIDTTPPVPGNFTVGKDGALFIPSVRRISGKFQRFLDVESPIVHYEWKLIDQDTGNDVVSFKTIPLTQNSPLMDGLNLISGKKYTAVLKGTNAVGLSSTINVTGVIPDDTIPACNAPARDVISFDDVKDKDFVPNLNNLTCMFSCYDVESGIQSIRAAVGTYPGGENIRPFVDIGELVSRISDDFKATWVAFDNINVTSFVWYYITIKIRNNAGLSHTISTDGILVDTTGPTVLPSYIRDGHHGIDKKFSSGFNVFQAHWENAFADAESGIAEYFVGLGTSPGSDDTSSFQTNGQSTRALISSIALESGVTYYVTVIACNGVQMCVNGSSNGALVDFIPPHSGSVIAGHDGPPLKMTWINKAAWARWQWCPADRAKLQSTVSTCNNSTFYDEHSGIKHFGMSVLSYDTAELLVPVKTVGRAVVSGLHVVMPNGVFSVVVEAEDRAGTRSDAISGSFIVDATPPRVITLHHGNEDQPIRYTRVQNHVFSAYFEMTEDVSDIAFYSLGVSTYPEGDDLIPFVTVQPDVVSNAIRVNWTSTTRTTLVNGWKYYITVKGTNSAGLFVIATSLPLIFDNEAPLVTHVLDGWGTQDAQYHSFPSIYRMHWQGVTDVSGIEKVKICLSSAKTSNTCDIHPLVEVSNSLNSYSFTAISLLSGTHCYALLRLKDKAGNVGNYWTDGVLIDTTPPTRGQVVDGQGKQDRVYQRETNILYASWSGFSENETSIHHYELAFGTSKKNSDIQPFTDVGLATSSPSSNLLVSELKNGVTYYARIIGFNILGVPSEIATSDGVLIDSTPPTFSVAVSDADELYRDLDYTNHMTSLSASWKCEDKDSGLTQTFVGFGTQPGIQDVAGYQAVLPYQTSYTLTNVTLSQGLRYFATVKCTNRVGLRNSVSSNGITIDSTPPLLSYVNDGDNTYQDAKFIGLGPFVTANWKFTDSESPVVDYVVSIHQVTSGVRVYGPSQILGNKRHANIALRGDELKHGQIYAFKVAARNGAGLNTTGVSNGFVVDGTAPVCSTVYDATLDGRKTSFVGQIRKLFVYFVCSDNETGINSYQFAIKDIQTSQFVLPFHKIKGISVLTSLVVVDGAGKRVVKLHNGGHYQVGLRATNNVNLTGEYWTPGVTVDITPPVFSKVVALFQLQSETIKIIWKLTDAESGIATLSWSLHTSPNVEIPKNFTQIPWNSTELIISGISFKLGQTYYVYFKATNKAGRSTLFVADGVVIDRTPPSVGWVSADFVVPASYDGNPNVTTDASFTVKWSGFTDQESGVRMYKWAIGPSTSAERVKVLADTFYKGIQFEGTLNGYVIKGQTVYTNTTYFVCIRVINGAGLSTTSCSNAVLVKLGKLTAGLVYDGPLTRDADFQLDDKAVWLHWTGFKDPVYGIEKYAWCYGEVTNQSTYHSNCTSLLSPVDPPLKTSAHQFHNISLLHGQRYSVSVQASNPRNQSVSAVSDGFTVDRSPPSAGVIKVGGSHGTRVIYLPDVTPPLVSWDMHESESTIKEYKFGIGTYPKAGDVHPFIKLNGSQQSVDLAEMNFNLTHGMAFYVTVVGINVVGLETSMISPQVIVDWLPPTPGIVRDGNGTSDIDFQVHVDHVSATWNKFLDPESDVVEYLFCIGARPDSCDVTNQTSVNLGLYATAQVNLVHGKSYFVTVTAINGAGLSTASSSNGVIVDITPPVIDGFSPSSIVTVDVNITNIVINAHPNITSILTNPYKVFATWNAVFDLESEIASVTVCASTIKDDCNLTPWKSMDLSSLSLSLHFPTPLQTGTVFMLKLKVKNGVGLETIAYSDNILVDVTPPLRGSVTVGNKKTLHFMHEGQPLTASWSNFVDSESNIKLYQWKICLVTEPSKCISEFVSIDLKTNLVLNDVGIEQGIEYNLVIKAINFAELEITALSNPFVLDNTPPESGMVFDGNEYSKDKIYQIFSDKISVSWQGFLDKESGITRYEICIGSTSGLCDVSAFKNCGLTTKAIINNLNLTHNETYYTTVRAVNGAGQTSFATSNGIIIDLTSPEGGSLNDGDVTVHDSYVSANWNEFYDPESGVSKYVICAGTITGSCDILPLTEVSSGLAVLLQVNPAISSGTLVYLTLRVYNQAGGVTEVHSDGILVDSTPPDFGKVVITSPTTTVGERIYLTNKSSVCASWRTFTDTETEIIAYHFALCLENNKHDCPISARDLNNRTSICIEEPAITEGQSYTIKITATNYVGLSSTTESPAFIIDTSEPNIGGITASNPLGDQYHFISSAILANWYGFIDPESGVLDYSACLGTEPALCDVTELVSVGNASSYTWHNLSLVHNVEYFVSIKSVNIAGLSTNLTASQPISADTTAPPLQNILDRKYNDFQRSRTHVSATWFNFEDPESDVISLTWCVGSRPRLCDLKPSTSLDVTVNSISAYLNQSIRNGDSYYVTLVAINGAGLTSVMVSNGITVDYTPPIAGEVIDGLVGNIDFLNDGETIYARWSGFEDGESAIKSYQFALCEKQNKTVCPAAFSDTGLQTNISLTGMELQSGKAYVIIVRAINMINLSKNELSNGFTVDATSPVSGRVVIISPSPNKFEINQITARWDNFIDPESGISEYEICLGTTQKGCNEVEFRSVGLNTTYSFTQLKLRHQETYYVTIKAINNAGLDAIMASDEIKIDLSPPQPVKGMSGSTLNLEDICNAVSDESCNTTTPETKGDVLIKVSCSRDLVEVSWLKHEDKESGVAKIEWCVESVDSMCDVQPWESVPTNMLTQSAVIHSLSTLTSIRVVVRITNGVGNTALLKSTECNPVKTFPPELNVAEVNSLNDTLNDVDYRKDTEAIIVSWLSPSNMSLYYSSVQAALTETEEDPNITDSLLQKWQGEPFAFEFMDIPHGKEHIWFSGDRIKPYTKYRPVVRRCNEVGLCRYSVGDGVMIVPDAPPDIEVNATDTFVGTEEERWKKYLSIPQLSRSMVEDTYFVSDPFSVIFDAIPNDLQTNELIKKHMDITYQASVHRVTSGSNETRNETVNIRHIFDHSRISGDTDVCCEKKNRVPRTIYPDQQIKPVQETHAFGVSVCALKNGLIVASSQDSAYVFSKGSYGKTSTTLVTFNSTLNNSFVKVKGIGDTVLVSGEGKLLLYRINANNLVQSTQILAITNCNHTFTDTAEHCVSGNQWSLAETVGKDFVYDGNEIIAVSGKHPTKGYGVVAVFRNVSNMWTLDQILGSERKDPSFGKIITINNDLMVVVGFHMYAYSRVSHNSWQNNTILSELLSNEIPNAVNVYLTKKNELFVLSVSDRTLTVFDLLLSAPANATQRCQHSFSVFLKLTGNFDVMEGTTTVVAVGIMSEGRDGSELVIYEPGNGCWKAGMVVTNSGLRFDSGQFGASVSISDTLLVIGTPGLLTWPSEYVDSGSGRVYVTSFCPRNSIRRKEFDLDNTKRVACVSCGVGEEAYPGFEEKCVNCSRNICLENADVVGFRVSHCDQYPCSVSENRTIMQNVSSDNLTVTESTPSFEEGEFYQTGSKQSYFIRITQMSVSGVTRISDSFPFSLDNTSPEPGSVYDGAGSDENKNCSANTTLSSEHQCSSRSFSKTDLDFTDNNASISARWINFYDNESDIENIFWCIGSEPLRDDIMGCENATNDRNRTLTGLSLQHNDTYYVTVLVCNYAGLCTAKSSDGVLVDTTPPVINYVRDGLIGPDIDFQVFTNMLFGNWAAEDPESGIVSYEIAWGSSPGLDDIWEFQEIGNAEAYYAKFKHGYLVKGRRYYITVKAINAAGLESQPVTSNGIIVGKTEFVFAKNDSGSFFFDTLNVNANETKEKDSGVKSTFGTLEVPTGAVTDEVKFLVYSLSEKEMKNGTDDNITVVDPDVVKPAKYFKLGDYSFLIKAYDPNNNTLLDEYHFKKPIIISLFYDVEQMLKGNKKTVSSEVTKEDIDPVLLLWDTKNRTWYDAAKTCPKPWTSVDHDTKVLKVQVCHLTQFGLFWTFEALNGIIEFSKETNGSLTREPPHAVLEEDNSVIYDSERYGNKMILDVVRRMGSTGTVNVTWVVTSQSSAEIPFNVFPLTDELRFIEGQWNSSIQLQFGGIPSNMSGAVLDVRFLNTSGGAMLGNVTSLKIVFPALAKHKEAGDSNIILKIVLPCTVVGVLLILAIIVARIFVRKRRRYEIAQQSLPRSSYEEMFRPRPDTPEGFAETSFTNAIGFRNPVYEAYQNDHELNEES